MKSFRRFEQEPQEDAGRPLRCYADGCPCRPTVIDGSREFCRYHALKDSDRWPGITSGLREHDWYIGFIGDLMAFYQRGEDGKAREMVAGFWIHEPEMLPSEHESRNFPHYLHRLHLDLGYRVGALKSKPSPIEPQSKTWRDERKPQELDA